MKALSKIAMVAGIISLVGAIVLRAMVREIVLGLEPSSFLEFSIACFLLTIAAEASTK